MHWQLNRDTYAPSSHPHRALMPPHLCSIIPALADACVVHRRLHTWVGAHQQDHVSLLQTHHCGVGHIRGADVSCRGDRSKHTKHSVSSDSVSYDVMAEGAMASPILWCWLQMRCGCQLQATQTQAQATRCTPRSTNLYNSCSPPHATRCRCPHPPSPMTHAAPPPKSPLCTRGLNSIPLYLYIRTHSPDSSGKPPSCQMLPLAPPPPKHTDTDHQNTLSA
jgi:hypothetical protein